MTRPTLTLLLILLLCTCGPATSNDAEAPAEPAVQTTSSPWLNPEGATVGTRFAPPEGFARAKYDLHEFGFFLRNQPLKPHGTEVRLFNGELKRNQGAHAAVLDVSVGDRDLQQCVDAVMRLRADYLYEAKRYADIHFNFVSGFNAEYARWREGERIRVRGNKVSWVPGSGHTRSNEDYHKYLTMVFAYAGTASLVHELKPRKNEEIEAGDVLIKGGSPGHAVIVVDKAVHPETGEIAVLLAQSYMPAQDIHVLVNPATADGSPWYEVSNWDSGVRTAEYGFEATALRTW